MLDERLLLVKNGNFTREDINKMPIWERKYYVDKLIELNSEKEKTKSKNH